MYGPRNSILDTIGHTPVARINKARRPATRIVLCEPDNAPSAVLCMIPDTGERYLSTPQFEGISETMTEEEEIASTEGYRIAAPSAQPGPVTATSAERPAPKPQATQLVDQTIRDNPVVMFALEWCELCWALRKFFRVHGIAYRSVDLDSVELQHDDLGGEIRQDLHRRLGAPAIPQVFVGGAADRRLYRDPGAVPHRRAAGAPHAEWRCVRRQRRGRSRALPAAVGAPTLTAPASTTKQPADTIMSIQTSIDNTAAAPAAWLIRQLEQAIAAAARQRAIRRAGAELTALSDRLLKDIGLNRSQIPSAVRERPADNAFDPLSAAQL
jgi:uncharacterized protein YjiS (DUF1127 family)/glutaredoxin